MRRTIGMTAALALLSLGEAAGCKDSNTTFVFDATAADSKSDGSAAAETGGNDAASDKGGTADSAATTDATDALAANTDATDATQGTDATDAVSTDAEIGQ